SNRTYLLKTPAPETPRPSCFGDDGPHWLFLITVTRWMRPRCGLELALPDDVFYKVERVSSHRYCGLGSKSEPLCSETAITADKVSCRITPWNNTMHWLQKTTAACLLLLVVTSTGLPARARADNWQKRLRFEQVSPALYRGKEPKEQDYEHL